jgi:Kdo2-lipid IVA lauroyltransferase/acyltransferase
MGTIGFYFFYALNWVITLLPLPVLYIFADFLFIVLYYFPSYRRKVVIKNLRNAFPEKSEEELRVIEKKFYRHLADLFVETLKLTHMSEKQMKKRFTVSNLEVLEKLVKEKRDVAVVMAHYNNWEWVVIIPRYVSYKYYSIYKPLQNRQFDKFLIRNRSQYGNILVPMSNIIREIITDKQRGVNSVTAFITDQTPAITDINLWLPFLNQDTAVYTGVEKIAAKFDMAVVFFNLQKVKRGYYDLTIDLLFEHTRGVPGHLISESHVRRLEEVIKEKPEFWLWSHRRWKHKRPAEYA